MTKPSHLKIEVVVDVLSQFLKQTLSRKTKTSVHQLGVKTQQLINKSKSQGIISGMKSMDQRASQSNIDEKHQDQDFINWRNNLKFISKKNMIANHKRHLTEPKVASISIPK